MEIKKISSTDVPNSPAEVAEVRLFCCAQNERLRLPNFLEHYRKIGVKRFFVVDNLSTDVTVEYLLTQPDVHVFSTDDSFARSGFGIGWHNQMLAKYGVNHWCVIADADELLVYPDCETLALPQFCARLESEGATAMQAILLDMYSDKPMNELHYKAGNDLLQCCHYFDRDYSFSPRLALNAQLRAFPPTEPIGGPRARLFFPRQYRFALWQRLAVKILFRLLKPLAVRGILHSHQLPHPQPQLFKIPLVKWQAGNNMITSHRLNPVPLARSSGALLHFKFLDDFAKKTADAIKSGQHYGGSIEYQRYGDLLADNPRMTFMYAGSRRYETSEDLLKAGLMRRGCV